MKEEVKIQGSWSKEIDSGAVAMVKLKQTGTSLVVQWVRLWAPSAGGRGWIPAQETRSHMHGTTKSPHAATKRSRVLQ